MNKIIIWNIIVIGLQAIWITVLQLLYTKRNKELKDIESTIELQDNIITNTDTDINELINTYKNRLNELIHVLPDLVTEVDRTTTEDRIRTYKLIIIELESILE